MNVLSGVLSGGTVSFHAIFAKAFRSIPIGVFLSQGYFWQENAKYRDKEKYKTVEGKTFFTMTAKEWFDETSLTQEQQTRVRETLVKHKVLIEWLTDNPARLFFHIDLEALVSVINQYLESGVSVSVDNRNKNRFKTQTRLGKKPKQDSVKNLTSYNEESLESLESEREGKRTPARAEISETAEEEKEKAPPVPPRPPDEAAAPTHIVKTIGPESNGVTEVEGIALPEPKPIQSWEYPNATNPKELKAVLLRYADQSPENWRDNVLEGGRATNWTAEKIDECLTDFCAWQFKTDFTKGRLSQYTAGFSLWLKDQPRFERAKPGASSTTTPQSSKAHLNRLGADEAHYHEPALF